MSDESVGRRLLRFWDEMSAARRLPWRADDNLHRRTLVEGLLAQTTASSVAEWYERIFEGIECANDWLDIGRAERLRRVAPLGLPRLKHDAVTGIALALSRFTIANETPLSIEGLDFLSQQRGVGPYTVGMVATLHGHDAAPVDCNVMRVGGRAHADGNAEAWIAEAVADAMRVDATPNPLAPPGYRAICAVLDIGAGICAPVMPDCLRCPLMEHCTSSARLGRQTLLPF